MKNVTLKRFFLGPKNNYVTQIECSKLVRKKNEISKCKRCNKNNIKIVPFDRATYNENVYGSNINTPKKNRRNIKWSQYIIPLGANDATLQ